MSHRRLFGIVSLSAGLLAAPSLALAGEDVSFDSLPPAVKTTVVREVKGGQIRDIEREQKKGQTVFEVEFVDAGVEWEIDVAMDGTLLKRRQD